MLCKCSGNVLIGYHCINHYINQNTKTPGEKSQLKTPVTWTNRQSTKSKEGASRDVTLVAPKTGMTSCGWVEASLPVEGGGKGG